MADDLAALLEEKQRREGQVTGGYRSVLAEPENTTTFEETKRAVTSLLKGSTKGIIDLVGGWGNVYDAISKSTDPNPLSSRGIVNTIAKLGGPDLMKLEGYKGLYDVGQAGAPAALLSTLGLPGLFSRTPTGVFGEFGVAGTTGLAAQQISPESPLAQLAMQSLPYMGKGAVMTARDAITKPTGQVPTNLEDLLRVGRMTPGEATGSRVQLATESRTEAAPSIEAKGTQFRQAQAQDVESFLGSVLDRASKTAATPTEATTSAFAAFNNYGKSLTSKLRSDASKDFGAAKASGGRVDTTPVISAITEQLASLPPEVPALGPLRTALQKIIDEYSIPAQEAKVTPSTILGPTGQPATVSITPAVPARLKEISIDRLQKNLSAWGEAVYSGKADLGKGNIFEGVAPGQVKGVALSVLRGFREALDQASTEGVAGADKLIKARDNFKANLARIEDYANRPLTKYFDVETVSALTPEKVMERMAKATPTERDFLGQVLQNSPEGTMVWDTVRRDQFIKLFNKAYDATAGKAADSPVLSLPVLLKELNSKKGDFSFLFPSASDKADVNLAIQYMQKVLKSESAGGAGGVKGGEVYSITRGAGGSSQLGNALKELTGLVKDVVANPNAFADVIFNPDTVLSLKEAQKANTPTKILNAVKNLGESLFKFAPRTAPMMGSTEQPTVTTEQQAQQGQDDLAALLEEQARRQQGQ